MNAKTMLALLFIGWTAEAVGAPQAAPPKQPAQPFSITITALSNDVKIGSAVDIKVQLTNTSNREMALGAGFRVYGNIDPMYSYECHDAEGIPAKKDFPIVGSLGDRAIPTLEPGKTQEEVVTISTACDFSRPKTYKIQLSRSIPGDPQHRVVKSNTIKITITP